MFILYFGSFPVSYDSNNNLSSYTLIFKIVDYVQYKNNKKLVKKINFGSYYLHVQNDEFNNIIKKNLYLFHTFTIMPNKWNNLAKKIKNHVNFDSIDINNVIILGFNKKDNPKFNSVQYDFYHVLINAI